MKSTFRIGIVVVSSLICSGSGLAAHAADTSPEMAAVVANDRAYEAAYAKADIKALADFFSDDADYTNEDGHTFSGRASIEEAIRGGVMANRGSTLTIEASTVRVLGPESVLEKGETTVTAKDGTKNSSLYTAIHVKQDGKWKINQLIESPVPVLTPREHLSELDWLLGEWEDSDKSDEVSVRSQYAWARGGNFLARSITVKRAGQTTLEGWQVIGWDPLEGCIHSWTFDGEGGFSEARWTRDGSRWLIRESGVTPGGNRTGADNTFVKVSADRCTWESNNRTLDGEPQPGISRIEINRVKGR